MSVEVVAHLGVSARLDVTAATDEAPGGDLPGTVHLTRVGLGEVNFDIVLRVSLEAAVETLPQGVLLSAGTHLRLVKVKTYVQYLKHHSKKKKKKKKKYIYIYIYI